MKPTTLIVIGAKGHGKMILEAARAMQAWDEIQICDDDPATIGATVLGARVRTGRDWLLTLEPGSVEVALGIGDNIVREHMASWLAERSLALAWVIHPAALVSPSAVIGEGAYIAPGAVIGAEARIGQGAIVNTAASVDHDCEIGAFAHVGPGAHLCGGVVVGARSMLGVGSSVAPLVRIGSDCRLGAGAALVRRLDDGRTAVGVPARPLTHDAIRS